MNKKKIIFDVTFIVIAAVVLTILVESGLIEKYIGFSLSFKCATDNSRSVFDWIGIK